MLPRTTLNTIVKRCEKEGYLTLERVQGTRRYCVDGEFLIEDHIYIVVGMVGRNVLNMSLANGPTIISCSGNAIMKFLQYVIR